MKDKKEKNLSRLSHSSIPIDFIKRVNGVWNHNQWEDFCRMLDQNGYTPIDLDMVGLLMEKKKAEFLTIMIINSHSDFE